MTTTMRVGAIQQHGGVEQMKLEHWPVPRAETNPVQFPVREAPVFVEAGAMVASGRGTCITSPGWESKA